MSTELGYASTGSPDGKKLMLIMVMVHENTFAVVAALAVDYLHPCCCFCQRLGRSFLAIPPSPCHALPLPPQFIPGPSGQYIRYSRC